MNNLLQAFVGTTYKCNLSCSHCYVNRKRTVDLSFEKICTILRKIKEMGVFKIVFTHGENLLRDDFLRILEFSNSLGFYNTLLTNGILLDNNNLVKLKKIGLNQVFISLDSLTEKYHNNLRNSKISWKKAIRAIDLCKENKIKYGITTTINSETEDKFDDFVKFASRKKASEIDFIGIRNNNCRHFLEPVFKKTIKDIIRLKYKYKNIIIGFHDPLAIQYLKAEYEDSDFIKEIIEENICRAGKLWISVAPSGNVYPCNFIDKKIGNIFDRNIEKKISEYNKKQNSRKKCDICDIKSLCDGGCKAYANNKGVDIRCKRKEKDE